MNDLLNIAAAVRSTKISFEIRGASRPKVVVVGNQDDPANAERLLKSLAGCSSVQFVQTEEIPP